MSHATDQKEKRDRDRRIRYEMLRMIVRQRANPSDGWITAQYVVEVLAASLANGIVPDGESHTKLLLSDLILGEYIEERDDRCDATEPFRLDTWSVRCTYKGSSLISRSIDPDPMIYDPRPRPRN